jgi:beta-glucosidase
VKASLGLLESKVASRLGGPKIDEASVRETARKVARESFVLLKNDGGALPLGPGTRAIALIGAAALSTNDHSWHGPAGYPKPATETLLLALEKRMKPGQQLRFEKGFADECGRAFAGKDDAIAAARRADLVVLVVSEDCDISGEGASRTDLGLSGVQQEMLEELVETGRPVALVIETGRPLTLTYAAKNAVAILVAWHPGTEGRTALAEVLTGEISPSGRLPMTFPRSVGQIPIAYNPLPTSRPWTGNRYTTGYLDEEVTPLYPFGHGLTYSSFAYSGLSLSAGTMPTDGEIEVSVMLANTGKVAASEVVQLYTRQLVAARSRPLRELKGFDKVTLAPGERRRVRFRLAASDLAYHDDEGRPIIEPGPFKVFVGASADADLSADFAIKAK